MTKKKNGTTSANWSLSIGHWSLRKGFTLVELIVSVAITSILMLGLSVFFSSTFHNLFQAQSQAENIQMQFAINEIIRDKFNEMDNLVQNNTDSIVTLNKNTKNQLPFSYIGKTVIAEKEHLAFKDLMIFNGVKGKAYSNTGTGEIVNTNSDTKITGLNNPAGFAYKESTYYIALPSEKKIMICTMPAQNSNDCNTEFTFEGYEFDMPIDVAINDSGSNIYVSDAGKGNIVKIPTSGSPKTAEVVTDGLNFPTGLAYYEENHFLFIADTFNHKIKRIDTGVGELQTAITVIGDGKSETCDNTAQFCKLNYPTGLVADANTNSLYISDSGNNRILRMYDPGTPDTLDFSFNPGDNYALSKIQFLNNDWITGDYDDNEEDDGNISNLIGDASHYGGKTFDNPKRLTTYVGGDCNSDTNFFHINEDLDVMGYVDKNTGDKLKLGENIYTITNYEKVDCFDDAPDDDIQLYKYKITVNGNNANTIGNNQIVYFSNQDTIEVFFNNVSFKNPPDNKTGFQTFEITTEDLFEGLVSTNYHVERLGDGYLGTKEDAIEVVADGLNFPTGISMGGTTIYFADSLNNEFKQIIPLNPPSKIADLSPIGTTTFSASADSSDFDYISNFTVKNLTFKSKNEGKILEMTLEAYTNYPEIPEKTPYQTYKINAAFP